MEGVLYMQFSVDKPTLLSQIQKISKVSPTRSTMPILNSILFEVEGNNLTLRSSDIEITMSTTFKVNGIRNGNLAIPNRMILDIVNEVEDVDVEFNANEDGLITLSAGKGVYEIMGRPGEEFPSVPNVTPVSSLTVENHVLRRMIHKTIIAVSRDELKPALMGVLFQIRKDELHTVATDGHRLVYISRKNFTSDEYEGDVIIPTKFLNLLSGYLDVDGTTSITLGENHVKVELDSTVIFSRIIDEQFPDFASVIPKDNKKILTASVAKIIATIRRVSIFSNKTTHQISFILNRDSSKVSTLNQENRSSAEEEIEVIYDADDMVIGYNAEYLKDILRNVETENVIMKLNTPISACVVFPEQQETDEELTMLLMPIRLND